MTADPVGGRGAEITRVPQAPPGIRQRDFRVGWEAALDAVRSSGSAAQNQDWRYQRECEHCGTVWHADAMPCDACAAARSPQDEDHEERPPQD